MLFLLCVYHVYFGYYYCEYTMYILVIIIRFDLIAIGFISESKAREYYLNYLFSGRKVGRMYFI